MNLIHGVIPGSPYQNTEGNTDSMDDIDKNIDEMLSAWQKEASKNAKDQIVPDSHYKLKKFTEDERLNKI